jgi:uncharacterized protein (TIGR00661 family)
MIPIARKLHRMNNKIFIGAGESHILFFNNELPGFTYIKFPGFKMKYSRYFPQYLVVLLKLPLLIFHIIREHFRLKKIIKKYSIDIVISDNRFGLWNSKVKSVYVTHMLRIPFPEHFRFLEFIGIFLHRLIIKKYDVCFIPDLPGEINISGRLSHHLLLPENVKYVGILSRFTENIPSNIFLSDKSGYITVILSGPEPQKEILKQKLTKIMHSKDLPVIMLEAKPEKTSFKYQTGNILFYNHLSGSDMKEMIIKSESIISRSGYTSIMELISLDRNALLIPTPGQTEQEYLACYLSSKGWCKSVSQRNLDENTEIPGIKSEWPSEIVKRSELLLEQALEEFLEIQHE